MSPDAASPRPPQVTVAAWAVVVSSVFVVVGAFDAMASLHSVDTRDRVTKAITTGGAKGLGFTVDDALEVMRWSLFVSATAAAIGGILAVYVLQRHRGARIALSVAAVPVVLTAPLSDSVLSMFIGAGAAVLWTRPARDWFAGRAVTPPSPPPVAAPQASPEQPTTEQSGPEQSGPEQPAPWLPPAADAQQPPPTVGWGAPAAPPNPYAPLSPYAPAGPYVPSAEVRLPLPRQLRVVSILTWVFTGLTVAGAGLLLLIAAVDSSELLRVARDNPAWKKSYDDVLVPATVIGSSVVIVWSISAAVLAGLMYRGHAWAAAALTVSTVLATVVSVLMFPVSLLHLVALAVSLGMLFGRPARAWYVASGRSGPHGRGGPAPRR